jgi:hypothetical protein
MGGGWCQHSHCHNFSDHEAIASLHREKLEWKDQKSLFEAMQKIKITYTFYL